MNSKIKLQRVHVWIIDENGDTYDPCWSYPEQMVREQYRGEKRREWAIRIVCMLKERVPYECQNNRLGRMDEETLARLLTAKPQPRCCHLNAWAYKRTHPRSRLVFGRVGRQLRDGSVQWVYG